MEGKWTIHMVHPDGSKIKLAEGTNRIVTDGKCFILNDIRLYGSLVYTEEFSLPERGKLTTFPPHLLEKQNDSDQT
jgi:hypothetical protein